jgi:cellulose binding protein with CBM3 domain
MQHGRSQLGVRARHDWRVIALGAAFGLGCATGVDVTDEELAEICAEANTTCGNGPGSGGSSGAVGSAGSGGSGLSGSSSGGTFNGTGGSSGSNSAGGSAGSSSAGTGGAGGSPGTGGSAGSGVTAPLAEGDCLDQSDVTVLYRDRSTGAASTNEPTMVLSVQNAGADFDLTDLTLRYWFTADGAGNFTGNVDYAALDGQQNLQVTVTFGQELGSDYAQLGFTTAGTVTSAGVREVQLRFHGNPYANMMQTNDFSFLSPATTATANRNITPYISGNQVGGCTPRP